LGRAAEPKDDSQLATHQADEPSLPLSELKSLEIDPAFALTRPATVGNRSTALRLGHQVAQKMRSRPATELAGENTPIHGRHRRTRHVVAQQYTQRLHALRRRERGQPLCTGTRGGSPTCGHADLAPGAPVHARA